MFKTQLYSTFIKYLILAALIYFPLFSHLDKLPIRIWDESRLAYNAYEMSKDNDFLVTHFEGKPDNWNTKPSLMVCCQALFIKLIGPTEIAIRLPSAIAALLTCVLLMWFSLYYLKSFLPGFISILILVTSQGYVDRHVSRTGDYDAMLTLFSTAFCFFIFLYSEEKKIKFLYLFFIALALAVLTKGVAGLFFMPAVAIYILYKKEALILFKNKHFYFGLLTFLIPVLGYYLTREAVSPGYLAGVNDSELGRRFSEAIVDHQEPFLFYYTSFITYQFTYWHLIFPAGLLFGIFSFNNKLKNVTLYFFILLLFFFTLISISKTKIEWYSAPMYPLLSLITAIAILYVFKWLEQSAFWKTQTKYNFLPYIFLFLIFIIPYQTIINKTFSPKETPWDNEFYQMSYFMRDALNGQHDLNGTILSMEGYNPHVGYYYYMLRDKGVNITYSHWSHLAANDTVIASQPEVFDALAKRFDFEFIHNLSNTKVIVLKEKPISINEKVFSK